MLDIDYDCSVAANIDFVDIRQHIPEAEVEDTDPGELDIQD